MSPQLPRSRPTRKPLLAMLGPGILVAATGVGAGDLATAAFTGKALGVVILWAVLLGAFFKFVLNEGLARWQLATGRTLLEGCIDRFGPAAKVLFLVYLLVWSFLVAAALMSAIGVTAHAMFPLYGHDAPERDKVVYGVIHSLLAVVLVRWGNYRLFEKVMSCCIGVMFLVVLVIGTMSVRSWSEVFAGLLVPQIPAGGVVWTVALMGGIGGTVTILSYGYWIREEGREGEFALRDCRIDLAAGYVMTALFGIGMVIIGSSLSGMMGSGAGLVVHIARQFRSSAETYGPICEWAFLIGAWGAVFSSLLGVWQGIPYLFADLWSLRRGAADEARRVDTSGWPYRGYLYAMAGIPILGLVAVDFRTMQQVYAVVGALFIPMLAAALLVLNGRSAWVGDRFRNSLVTSLVLLAIIGFFIAVGVLEIVNKVASG